MVRVFEVPSGELGDFRRNVFLLDGGVADNLGLEEILSAAGDLSASGAASDHIVFVSDAGAAPARDPHPSTNLVCESFRALDILFRQPGELRRRLFLMKRQSRKIKGAYWEIRMGIDQPAEKLEAFNALLQAEELSSLSTRLKCLSQQTVERLVDWGYAAAAYAIQRYAEDPTPLPTAEELPFRIHWE